MATRSTSPAASSRVHDLPPGDQRIRQVAHSRPGDGGQSSWTIAEIADEFGITHRTVRHYEDLGLISPERQGTRRIYGRRDRTRLSLILRGKRLGFPLEEIRTIIDLYDAPRGKRSQLEYVLAQIDERRADLEQRRADIEAALTELDGFERRCRDELTTPPAAAQTSQ
jgi:DNA-binding transcriptional MerR regulator